MNVQMSYLIGALVIFTMLAVVFNQKENYDLESRLFHEAVGASSELGSALLTHLNKLPFDEATISATVEFPDELTNPASLKPETGELYVSQFDDLDDYNYFDGRDDEHYIYDTLKTLGIFATTIKINYIQKDTPQTVSSNETWYKIINIEITNMYLSSPIKLFLITSY